MPPLHVLSMKGISCVIERTFDVDAHAPLVTDSAHGVGEGHLVPGLENAAVLLINDRHNMVPLGGVIPGAGIRTLPADAEDDPDRFMTVPARG